MELFKKQSMTRGAIFCQVNTRIHWGHAEQAITWGNQKWRGAAPAFSSSIKEKTNSVTGERLNGWVEALRVTNRIRIVEAMACTMKYLIDASTDG